MPARLLIVHHTVSPATESMLRSVVAGTEADGISGVEVVVRPALSATASDVLAAGAVALGTPANIGYISGALKHFFDQIYYPVREATAGLGFGLFLHSNEDATGALRAVEAITTGLGWRRQIDDVIVKGTPDQAALDACWELGATLAAGVMMPD